MSAPFVTETDLMMRLVLAQNHPGNQNRDVITFAGFCDDRPELLRHVVACEKTAAEYDAVRA